MNKKTRTLPRLCEAIIEYARLLLQVFLQAKTGLEKDQIISKLDNSLLDRSAYDKLKESIAINSIIITQ